MVAVVPEVDTRTLRGAEGMPVSVFADALDEAGELPTLLCAVTRNA
jgi:hypothetical protein